MFTTVHKSIRFVRPSTSQKDTCIPLCFFDVLCDVAFHGMVSTNREKERWLLWWNFWNSMESGKPWLTEVSVLWPHLIGSHNIIWQLIISSWLWIKGEGPTYWQKQTMVHTVLLAYTLTKKCTWYAPKIAFKCQFKKFHYSCCVLSFIVRKLLALWIMLTGPRTFSTDQKWIKNLQRKL